MAIGEILILLFMMFGVSLASASYIKDATSLNDISPFLDDIGSQIKEKNDVNLNQRLANALGIAYTPNVTPQEKFLSDFYEKFGGELSTSAAGVSVVADSSSEDGVSRKVSLSKKIKDTVKVISEEYAKGNLRTFELQEKFTTEGQITDAKSCWEVVNKALQANDLPMWYTYNLQEVLIDQSIFDADPSLKNFYLIATNCNVSYNTSRDGAFINVPNAIGLVLICSAAKLQNARLVKDGDGARFEYLFLKSEIDAFSSVGAIGRIYTQSLYNLNELNPKYKYNYAKNALTYNLQRREEGIYYVYSNGYILGGLIGEKIYYRYRAETSDILPTDFSKAYATIVNDILGIDMILKDSVISGTKRAKTFIDKKAAEKLRDSAVEIVNASSIAKDNTLVDTNADTVAVVRARALEKWREKAEKEDDDLLPATLPLINTIGVDIGEGVAIGYPKPVSIDQAVEDVTSPDLPFIDTTPKNPQASYEANNGLFTIYQPTKQAMIDLAYFLWSAEPVDSLKKLFGNPIDCIVSLALYPFKPTTSTSKNIYFGFVDSGVSAPTIKDIFQTIELGSIFVPEYYNNFLDYSPYTKISIYLPFIGICQLNVDDVMGGTISVEYRVELISGSCLCTVKVKRGLLNVAMYQFSGSMSLQVPVSGANFTQVYKSVIETIGATAASIYSGGLSAAFTPSLLGTAVKGGMSAKPEVTRSGGMGGNSGFLGVMQPYLIIERPQTSIPTSFVATNGVVSNVTSEIGAVSGFCRIMSANLNGINCTQEEKTEIRDLLESGIFV